MLKQRGAIFAILAAASMAVWAQDTEGEVRKIDKSQAKITLKHGAIKNLDMPPMQMVFRVKNPALLDKVQEGDRVRFSAERIDGQYTVTTLQPLR